MNLNVYFKIFLLFLVNSPLLAGTGIQSDPFTVSQAIAKNDGSSQTYWVKGFVVGEMSDFSNNKYFYELAPPFNGTSAYLMADNPDEINLAKCMPVQLGAERSNTMDLYGNPQFWRKEVLTCGLLRDYFAMPGLKTLSSLEVLSPSPLADESKNWNFYEDMDGSYTASSTTSIFAGGTYTGETGEWQLYGATWGDSGNDNKWGKASARLRLSESSSGTPGYLQMNFDKADGAGVIRIWAGYYNTDSNGAIAIQTSRNSGLSWETAVTSQFIAKDWKEYQFTINQTGKIRIRIIKAETGSAGINIDKIRISDYKIQSAIPDILKNEFSYTFQADGIHLMLNNPTQKLALFNLSGNELWKAENVSGSLIIKAQKGVYILKINGKSYKLAVR